ncbi:metallophosphoesterase [Agrilactobacillus fermenti]|uniref:metallophosphoesterase n=1 Tax=Agrilactobacillus fermenti TaxID=2586909 RepID=UPI001E644A65|nr:metallophosphoesterase [Agrilactobacillus fermenti]MCD2255098.1 metallophosphoesterase [Agrilactobacillus fermenti]
MVKIAMSSDNHIDVNHLDAAETLSQQLAYLLENQFDYYLIAGDLFNDFQKSLAFVRSMNQQANGKLKVYFIAGNHDMVNGTDYPTLQTPIDPVYLHQKVIDIPDTNYRIIGNNGWYDYTFGRDFDPKPLKAYIQWRNAYWIDGGITGLGDDLAMMQTILNQVYTQFLAARAAQKKIIFITHFVPRAEYIFYSLDRPYWNMVNPLLGSQHLGALIEAFQIEHVMFGHLHVRHKPRLIHNTTYYSAPVGYGLKRMHEWVGKDFMTEWQQTLQIIKI